MPNLHGYNLREPSQEAAGITVYLEKHRLLEITRRLMLELGMKRTTDVKGYIKNNIRRIANEVNTTNAFLLAPSVFDLKALSDYMRSHFNVPTIVYTKERRGCESDKLLKKFKKFLKANNLEGKNIIYANFPTNRVQCLQFRKEHIEPKYVVEIQPCFQVPFKTRNMLEEENSAYIEKSNQVKYFYSDISQTIHYGKKPIRVLKHKLDVDPSNYKPTIEEIGLGIVEMFRNSNIQKEEIEMGRFLPRIVMIGRKGAGKRTQAKAVAKHFNLVLIDVQDLILQEMHSHTSQDKAIRSVRHNKYSDMSIQSIIYKRILENDCLKKGWILVGYPHSVDELKQMQEFIVPPNKIIFLHCRERLALRRLNHSWVKKNLLKSTQSSKTECNQHMEDDSVTRKMLENEALEELNLFNLNKVPLLEYLSTKKETIHIDANHTAKTVLTKICARICQQQNSFGIYGKSTKEKFSGN